MAKVSIELLSILRQTAANIAKSEHYQWGHMGACNCGFLAQAVTQLSKGEIHSRAMQGHGDWTEQLNDYCPTSGLLFDDVITALLHVGFDVDELKHLETLSLPSVLNKLDRLPRRNYKADVIMYINTWADLLEEQLIQQVRIPGLNVLVNADVID